MRTDINRKEEIQIIAAKLFTEKGFNAVSMRDLAMALGIKASSLYNHIQSKKEILSLIIMTVAEHFTEGIQEIITSPLQPLDKLKQTIQLHVRISLKHRDAIGCLNSNWPNLEEPQLSNLKKMREDYEENVRLLIRSCKKNEQLKTLNEEVMLYSVLSTLRSVYQWSDKTAQMSEEELVAELQESLLGGLVVNKA